MQQAIEGDLKNYFLLWYELDRGELLTCTMASHNSYSESADDAQETAKHVRTTVYIVDCLDNNRIAGAYDGEGFLPGPFGHAVESVNRTLIITA